VFIIYKWIFNLNQLYLIILNLAIFSYTYYTLTFWGVKYVFNLNKYYYYYYYYSIRRSGKNFEPFSTTLQQKI
jgi:hypothetical protein